MSVERILSFSDILDGTFLTFSHVNHIAGSRISVGFNLKLLNSCCAAKRTSFNMYTHLQARFTALAILHVCIVQPF